MSSKKIGLILIIMSKTDNPMIYEKNSNFIMDHDDYSI
jgi:hypothetical protein